MRNILNRAEKLHQIISMMKDTYPDRNKGAQENKLWQNACDEYHKLKPTLIHCYDINNGLRSGTKEAVDESLYFLLSDIYVFGSGYAKEFIWHYLMRLSLSRKHIEYMEIAALKYINRRICREFRYMCRAMNKVASNHFWDQVHNIVNNTDCPLRKYRAEFILLYQGDLLRAEFTPYPRLKTS